MDATFADMAILLMAMFVLLIALAETAKQRNTMFSIPGENQSAFGTQDLVESDGTQVITVLKLMQTLMRDMKKLLRH